MDRAELQLIEGDSKTIDEASSREAAAAAAAWMKSLLFFSRLRG